MLLSSTKGSELVGLRYVPLFPFFAHLAAAPGSAKGAFRVVSDAYVTDDSGTGVVHQVQLRACDRVRVVLRACTRVHACARARVHVCACACACVGLRMHLCACVHR